jgi:4-diphosphocytidyl-2-C-methyl-D-erythritol kinase
MAILCLAQAIPIVARHVHRTEGALQRITACHGVSARRGEIVEDVPPPLPLSTPLLLVKPPVGLSTPEVFRALDLNRRSAADPRALLAGLASGGAVSPELCVNDLEQPAFDVLPDLAALKQRLQHDSGGRFSAVFMTGAHRSVTCICRDACAVLLMVMLSLASSSC